MFFGEFKSNCFLEEFNGKNAWKLVDAFFDEYNLVDHHIKSYNDFVNHRIQDIIDITEPIVLNKVNTLLRQGM